MLVTTEKMISGGACIAHIDGKAVFVPYSLPGETVEIEITDDRKDYAFARTLSVTEASSHRVDPLCPYFGRCGGCSLQMADTAYQTELRLSILKDVFSRAHVEIPVELRAVTGDSFGYRSRFQFHRTANGSVGLKEEASKTVIPVTDCPVAVPEIRKALADGSLAALARHHNAEDRFHVFAYKGVLGHSDGNSVFPVPVLDRSVSFDVRGFFQSNIPMLEKMIQGVCRSLGDMEASPRGRLLDFYSGVGTFSSFAGPLFAETVLVEHNKEALALAETNLSHLKTKPLLCPVNDESWPMHRAARLAYDSAIIDPPRQGISKKAIEWLASSGIPDIRYVSCDPVTLARDAAKLVAAGYILEDVTMYDFYPQTAHLETLALFRKKD